MIKVLLLLTMTIGLAVSISPAHAQHHSGALAPPVDFDGMAVALSSILSPEDFTFGDTDTANLEIRFFDSISNTSIESVTYRIQIFQENNLVANEYFFDEDGKLDLEIRPIEGGCENQELWKCTKYFGEKHPIAGAYYARGDSRPIIQGPVFDQSGQYNVKVSIVGATNPKTMTTSDLHFETFLSIPEKQTFLIQTANAEEFPVLIKSFDNRVLNFSYDESSNKISYEIPFEHLHSLHHDSSSRQNIYLEKNSSILKEGHDVEVYIEGVKLEKNFVMDKYSQNKNILKLEIPHEEILSSQKKSGTSESNNNIVKIDILSGKEIQMKNLDFNFDNGQTATVSLNANTKSGQNIPFTFAFYNSDGTLTKDILYAYSVSDSSGNEIWSNIGNGGTYLGILVPSGIHKESIHIPSDGNYQLKIILTGLGTENYESFFTSNSEFSIVSIQENQEILKTLDTVPGWIKNNAGWWAEGIVEDSEFVQSIQFLIKEDILIVPDTESQKEGPQEIPGWIKNNAGWWADDLISDRDFMKGIQFLVEQGIVIIN